MLPFSLDDDDDMYRSSQSLTCQCCETMSSVLLTRDHACMHALICVFHDEINVSFVL